MQRLRGDQRLLLGMARRHALGPRALGRGALLALLALTSVGLGACGGGPGPGGSQPRDRASTSTTVLRVPAVGIFGDSLAWEAEPYFRRLIGASGERTLEFLAIGGTAPCDLQAVMDLAARSREISVAVLAFGGNALTPCMSGATASTTAKVERYRRDVGAAVATFKANGVPVVLVAPPISRADYEARNREAEAIGALYTQMVAEDPTWLSFVDAGAAVEGKGGRYTRTLPCLRDEPCLGTLVNGQPSNVVRSPDGVHFCPVRSGDAAGQVDRCPVYSSGAYRYALALAEAALRPAGSPTTQPS